MKTEAGKKDSLPRRRPATNADCEQIRDLVFGMLTEYGLKPDPDGIDADLKDIEQSYFNRGGEFCVLEDADGRIIATCALYKSYGFEPYESTHLCWRCDQSYMLKL